MEHALVGIAVVLALGMAAQWLAWRLRLPSILLLLVSGFAAGPDVAGIVDPDALLGTLLLPVVEVAAALILFEGGLSLRVRELGGHAGVVTRLVTFGLLVTWALATAAGVLLLRLPIEVALLLGAVLTVSGPTVVQPLLRHVRPRGPSGTILKWEGIVIDPIGAVLAVLVFEAVVGGRLGEAAPTILLGLARTLAVGGVLGGLAAWILLLAIRRYWIPDWLHNPVSLALVVGVFALSDVLQPDSGLLTVTLLGVLLANQADVSVLHIVEFKENLRVLLISSIFVLLAARLRLADLAGMDLGALGFLAALVLVVRPVSAWLCTARSGLSVRERAFIAWMFPRGIVAAAVASVFALRLDATGLPGADRVAPVTFLVIVGTVLVYGLTAEPLARRLGLATPNPQGVLFIGANPWAREMAHALAGLGIPVCLADTNRRHVSAARMQGLRTWYGDALGDTAREDIDTADLGSVLAVTPNDEVNVLAMLHWVHRFGRERTYRLARDATKERTADGDGRSTEVWTGRVLFGTGIGTSELGRRVAAGAQVKATLLTEVFDLDAFRAEHGEDALLLFAVSEGGILSVATAERPLQPAAGHTVLALVGPRPSTPAPAPPAAAPLG